MYKTKDELIQSLIDKYAELNQKLVVVQSSKFCLNCAVYDNEDLIDSYIALYDDEVNIWEIIYGQMSSMAAQLYIAYVSQVCEIIEEKYGYDDADALTMGYFDDNEDFSDH